MNFRIFGSKIDIINTFWSDKTFVVTKAVFCSFTMQPSRGPENWEISITITDGMSLVAFRHAMVLKVGASISKASNGKVVISWRSIFLPWKPPHSSFRIFMKTENISDVSPLKSSKFKAFNEKRNISFFIHLCGVYRIMCY